MSIRRPGDEGALAAAVRARLASAGRAGLAKSELLRDGELGASSGEIARALSELTEAGETVERNRRWILLEDTPWRRGRVQSVSGGDAVVWPLEAGSTAKQPAFFVARRHLKKARDGDRVLVQPRKQRRRRPAHHLPEATVVAVLTRRGGLVGRVEDAGGYCRLAPFDSRIRLEVELPESDLARAGRYVVVDLEESPGAVASRARGRVVEDLGRLSEPGADVAIALRHFEIPEDFPPATLEQAAAWAPDPPPEALAGREDLRTLLTVTIDGETARDFDDAISLEELAGGGLRLGVHIADVGHYVPEGSALDLEAYRRGTSVYFPGRAVPMLPESLSNGLCSLQPGVDRLTLTAFLDFSPEGELLARRFAESVIRSHRRLTYGEVRRLLEEPDGADEGEYGAELLELLRRARRLMRLLLARRVARGSIDFDLPSGDVILDTDGRTIGIQPGQRTVAHRVIEECMIAANEAVAAELDDAEVPALHRAHETPGEERLTALAEILEPLGIELDVAAGDAPPAALQRVLAEVEGRPEEPFVASLVLQAMQRAQYNERSLGHYALASSHYTHFTSPIRRYPDLVVHRQLRNHLRARVVEVDMETLLTQRLPAIAAHTSSTERRAERAERLVLDWKALRLLVGREGDTLTGRVTGVKEYGLFVRLVDEHVDGLVPISTLGDDFYEYRDDGHLLVGRRSGRVFRLADEVRVVVKKVDVHRRLVDLAIEGMPAGERERSERRGRERREDRRGREERLRGDHRRRRGSRRRR